MSSKQASKFQKNFQDNIFGKIQDTYQQILSQNWM